MKCPDCGSGDVEPTKDVDEFKDNPYWEDKRTYHCHDCKMTFKKEEAE